MFLLVAILILILYQANSLQSIESVSLTVLSPVQYAFTYIGNQVREASQTVYDLAELRRRNQELQGLADKLMIENVRLKEIESENKTLMALLNFVETYPSYEYVASRVIGRDPGNLLGYILIDAGHSSGIRPGMAVVTERGLVGQVIFVGDTASKVLLVTDSFSAINAVLQTSRATGIVKGKAGGQFYLDEVPQGATIEVGDIVLTSGLGGNFPRGLVIGQVTEVERQDMNMFQQAALHPTVDFNKLEVVLVVNNFEQDMLAD